MRPEPSGDGKADISADARRWCPEPRGREDGGRSDEAAWSGVLFRFDMADIVGTKVSFKVSTEGGCN